jgi:hypothetical protein
MPPMASTNIESLDMEQQHGVTMIGKILSFIRRKWVMDVPTDIEICEFHCNRPYCEKGQRQECERLSSLPGTLTSRRIQNTTPSPQCGTHGHANSHP